MKSHSYVKGVSAVNIERSFPTFSHFPILHRYSYPNDLNNTVYELAIEF